MPIPNSNEQQDEFIKRCVPILVGEGKENDQAVAICNSVWENRKEQKGIQYRMGKYIKALNDKCILEDDIKDIIFDKSYEIYECINWLKDREISYCKEFSIKDKKLIFHMKTLMFDNDPIQVVELDKGINAICINKKSQLKGEDKMKELNADKLKKFTERPQMVYSHAPMEIVENKGYNDEFIIEGFASTGEIDRDADIVTPNAFKNTLAGYMENPILCYMHNWMDPIGSVIDARIMNPGEEHKSISSNKTYKSPTGGLFIRASISKTAPKIRELVKENHLKAFSIGFMIKEASFDQQLEVRQIDDIELFEVSVVSIPSNRRSLFSIGKALSFGTDIVNEGSENPVQSKIEVNEESDSFRMRLFAATKKGELSLKGVSAEELVGRVSTFGGFTERLKKFLEEKKTIEVKVTSTINGTTETAIDSKGTSHEHTFQVSVETDASGGITKVEGITDTVDDHQHPIREAGKTETIDGHYHDFEMANANTNEEPMMDEPVPMQGDQPMISEGASADRLVIQQKDIKQFATEKKSSGKSAASFIDQFLNTESHKQKELTNSYSFYKMALLCKAIDVKLTSGDWIIEKLINLNYYGELIRPVYAYMELGRDKKEELLISGYLFIKNEKGEKIVLNVHPSWNAYQVTAFYKPSATDSTLKFFDDIKLWMTENNFFKGEKISASGTFLPINEITFDEVKLAPELKEAIRLGSIEFFNKKELYKSNNLAFKRGMIFAGEPGTGKTLTGKVLMSQAKSTFIWVTAEDLCYGFKHLFDMARELSPSILYIEDIDNSFAVQSDVDTIKTQMDGLETMDGIVTILCTNFPKNIPTALIDRPGRFDDVIKFELPDQQLRYEILDCHSKEFDIEDRESILQKISKETEGFAGAHLKELIVYAMLLAIDDNRSEITGKDLIKALDKIKKNRKLINDLKGEKSYVKYVRKLINETQVKIASRKHKEIKNIEKEYKIPEDIMNDILDCVISDEININIPKLTKALSYLVDILDKGAEQANVKYLLSNINDLLDASGDNEKAIQGQLMELINTIVK